MNRFISNYAFMFIVLLYFCHPVDSSNLFQISSIENPVSIFWNNLNQVALNQLNITQNCKYSLESVIKGLHKGQIWSYQMLDSSSKSLDGILEGNYLFLGKYEECLAIRHENDIVEGHEEIIKGQYVLLELVPSKIIHKSVTPINLQLSQVFSDSLFRLRTAVCLPSECNSFDVQQLFEPILHDRWRLTQEPILQKHVSFVVTLQQSNIYEKLSIYGLTLFVWIVIVCTWIHNSTLKSSEIVKEMSINVNYSQIANKPSKVQKQHILFFDGLRFVNFSWIIVGHAFLYISMAFSFFTFLGDYAVFNRYVFNNFFGQVILFSETILQFLFVLPAITTSYKVESDFRRNNRVSKAIIILIERAINQWPIQLVVIAFQFCLPVLFSGSLSPYIFEKLKYSCIQNWWKPLLYVSNMDNFDQQCAPHLWTISLEIQLFTVALMLGLVYSRTPRLGLLMNGILIFIGLGAQVFNTWFNNVWPFVFNELGFSKKSEQTLNLSYKSLLEKFAPYFIIFWAVHLHKNGFKIKENIKNKVTCVLFGYYLFMQTSHGWFIVYDCLRTPEIISVFVVFYKQTIAICMSWCILAYGDILNQPQKLKKIWIFAFYSKFLPLFKIKRFQLFNDHEKEPFSIMDGILLFMFRLIKSIYFSHPFLIVLFFIQFKSNLATDPVSLVHKFFGDAVLFLLLGLIFHLFFDGPLTNLCNRFNKKYISIFDKEKNEKDLLANK